MSFIFITNKWTPQCTCSALEKQGLEIAWNVVQEFFKNITDIEKNRTQQNCSWMHELIQEKLMNMFYGNPENQKQVQIIEKSIAQNEPSPSNAAYYLIEQFIQQKNKF